MYHPANANGEPSRPPLPYEDAPRLPEGENLSPHDILGTPQASAADGLELEVGPGRGSFLLERLQAKPEVCMVGLEIRLKWASLVDERVKKEGLSDRCRVFAEDIRLALPRMAAASCSRVFIHFPDPWWKKRHSKRRLANGGVMDQIARVLQPGGELFVQTDVWGTARAYRDALAGHEAFEPAGDEPGVPTLSDNPYEARSPREKRSIADGMPVVRMRYRRK